MRNLMEFIQNIVWQQEFRKSMFSYQPCKLFSPKFIYSRTLFQCPPPRGCTLEPILMPLLWLFLCWNARSSKEQRSHREYVGSFQICVQPNKYKCIGYEILLKETVNNILQSLCFFHMVGKRKIINSLRPRVYYSVNHSIILLSCMQDCYPSKDR